LLTVGDYHEMARTGVLREDDRVELIEGELVVMSPVSSRHAGCVKKLAHRVIQIARRRAIIGVHDPVRLGGMSEPEPDITVLLFRDDFYRGRHPEPRDVALLVEVADTSLSDDRRVKLPLYARHGIPEVWIVDLTRNRIEVHRVPGPDGYADSSTHKAGDRLAVPLLDTEIDVEEVVPDD